MSYNCLYCGLNEQNATSEKCYEDVASPYFTDRIIDQDLFHVFIEAVEVKNWYGKEMRK